MSKGFHKALAATIFAKRAVKKVKHKRLDKRALAEILKGPPKYEHNFHSPTFRKVR